MESGQDYSGIAEMDRIGTDLENHSDRDSANEDNGSVVNDSDGQYSPTRPTGNSPSNCPPGEYSPTNPTDEIDLLEDIFTRTERSEEDERPGGDDNLSVNNDHAVDDNITPADNPSGVLEMESDEDNQNDSDSESRLVIQEEADESDKKDSLEEDAKDNSEEEETGAQSSQECAGSQEGASQFELSETFLDNLNPQDDSQYDAEEDEVEMRSDSEQQEEGAVEAEPTSSQADIEGKFSEEEKQGAEEAASSTEEVEEACPSLEEKEEVPSSVEKEGEASIEASCGIQDEEEGEASPEGEVKEDKELDEMDEREEKSVEMEEKEDAPHDSEEGQGVAVCMEENEEHTPCMDEEMTASPKEEGEIREEGEESAPSSPDVAASASDADDSQGGDVLQLTADQDLEVREDDAGNKQHGERDNSSEDDMENVDRDKERTSDSDRSPVYQPSPVADDLDRPCEPDSEQVVERNSDEEDSRSNQGKSDRECKSQESPDELSNGAGTEEGIDIIETSVDLDERDYSAESKVTSFETHSKGSPALGVTRVIQRGVGEKDSTEGDSRTVQTNEDDSEDDVQIIECPPQEPIDTLIVDDDDDDDDVVPSSSRDLKAPVSELPRSSKKKRTVEHDGHDLRIVIRDERRERDESDRRRRRHDKERREERRSDSHRRSESDRKSSDRSSRRRHHRSRSRSRERRRRRSRSRSRSRERSSRRRRHRDRSKERSPERERSSHKKRKRDRSRERRRRSRSRSQRSHSPKRVRADSWDKENHEDHTDQEVVELSRSKRRHYRRHEDKHDESPDVERNSRKREESPVMERSSRRHTRTWSPSDTFQKDPSDTPSPGQSPAEKSDEESEEQETETNSEEVERHVVLLDKEEDEVQSESPEKVVEVLPEDIPIPDPVDIPVPEPETIPVPEPKNIPVPESDPLPEPEPVLNPEPPTEELLQPPVPEEEPMENPPEPPPLPAGRPDGLPAKGEGLLPTPIRRRAALEEVVYDPAHPTDEETERFMFPGMPNPPHPPHPDMMGGPPRLPGQLLGDGTFVVSAPGEGGLLGPPPQRVPLQAVPFSPHRPLLINPVVSARPPFSNGPFPTQLPAPPLGARFRLQMGRPGSVIQLQNQFGQQLPPGPPPPPPERFPGQVNDRFEEGPPHMGQFPGSGHSSVPEMANLSAPPGHLPSDMHMMPHPLSHASVDNDGPLDEDKFLVAPNMLPVIDDKMGGELRSMPPPSVFKVPLPPGPPAKSPGKLLLSNAPSAILERGEDSTEVMDMDMSPLDEDCELELPTPPELADGDSDGTDKKLKPLAAIDLKELSNAIKKLTSRAGDDVPTSAVELTNNEKYMKKLHLQERVVDEVKQALRPFYSHKKISKEEYKNILRRAVPKICHSKSGDINPVKIQQLVKGYVSKYQKQREHSEKKNKSTKIPSKDKGKANGERSKPTR